MVSVQDFSLEFGIAEHGWLPVSITLGGRVFTFVASCIPENPVAELIYAVNRAAHGLSTVVQWHCEPNGG